MLHKWLHVTLLLQDVMHKHPPPDSSLGFVTLSLTFGLLEGS